MVIGKETDMTFRPSGTGYAVPVDEARYANMLAFFSTSDDELQNIISPGDFERAGNVLDAQAADGYDKLGLYDLVGPAGVWYIWSQQRDAEVEALISRLGFDSAPDGYFHNVLGFVFGS